MTTPRVRLRWRTDAHGYVARFAGHWAHPGTFTRQQAEDYARATPNGAQLEVVALDGEGS